MSNCPSCGLPPTATTEDVANDEAFYECENGHEWPADT